MDYFFYGTLMEPRVLHAVLRHPVAASRIRPAVLDGYRRVYRDGASYPVIVPDRRSAVDGIMVRGLSASDAVLLQEYEGPDYETARLPARTSSRCTVLAAVFVPSPSCRAAPTLWRYAAWRRRFARRFIQQVRRTRRTAPAVA